MTEHREKRNINILIMNKQHLYGIIDYTSLVKSQQTLSRILKTAQNEAEKMGVVKAFEIAYELSWKTMKKILEFRGLETGASRDVFREAAKLGIISDAERWFSYIQKRNITVHAYQPEILDYLFTNTAKEFLTDLNYLLERLEKEAPNYVTNGK
jgi:nucleotidyltransferase substrate binding protein (TIGR01987 family)